MIQAVRYQSYEMPPSGKLADNEILALESWIEMGAPWPETDEQIEDVPREQFDLLKRKSEHWAWQPIRSPEIPGVENDRWPRCDIDRFILARIEQEAFASKNQVNLERSANSGAEIMTVPTLEPTVDTDKSALLRRLYFDIIGLPPTPQQAKDYLADPSEQSTAKLVDELLLSPHFGERWGRHWLDLVRYAESRGHEFDGDAPNAFQYRDYVIRAFNNDVPYDQFVREHIAGDLLEVPRLNRDSGFNESILGTGFWFLGEWTHSPVDIRKDETDRFDNMIDVMSKTLLGVTVACARCHDHKFDAISTADYYSLAGFLQSSDYRQVRFETLQSDHSIASQLESIDSKYQRSVAEILSRAGLEVPKLKLIEHEHAQFVPINYEEITHNNYLQDGFIFGQNARAIGDAMLQSVNQSPEIFFADLAVASNDLFWNKIRSVSERGVVDRSELAKIPRSGRTLRTPTFLLTDGELACRVLGQGHVVACVDSHRLIAGPLHGETIKSIDAKDQWIKLNLERYVGHRIHLEFTPAEDSQLAVAFVTQGASQNALDALSEREKTIADAIQKISQDIKSVVGDQLATMAKQWQAERDELCGQLKTNSHLAIAMMDGTGEDDHVLIRGNSSKPGKSEPRHFLTAISSDKAIQIASGSGRLELAAAINDAKNPLTDRVIVNRIWHHLLGRGIVPTTDDFGVLGQRPSHPELLDHLATTFIDDGRSIKSLIRRIVLSRTYQLSSVPSAETLKFDPQNLLFHYRPPQRLQGEIIRDALLSISGRLNTQLYGEPIPIHLTDFMDGRGKPGFSGPLDGDGRRSIYIAVRRNFLSPFMLTFDTPAPFSTMGRRNTSNVPAQALILMNDPFVVQQADSWAKRAFEQSESTQSRIVWLYQTAFAREPSDKETNAAIDYLERESLQRDLPVNDLQIWKDLAHVLINTKEFIFLR